MILRQDTSYQYTLRSANNADQRLIGSIVHSLVFAYDKQFQEAPLNIVQCVFDNFAHGLIITQRSEPVTELQLSWAYQIVWIYSNFYART